MSSTFTVATIANKRHPLLQPGMIRKPRRHPAELLACAHLHGGEGDAGSLLDPRHHNLLMVLHQENLSEASFLHLLAGSRQLLLQRW
jgi:hypothetical protein